MHRHTSVRKIDSWIDRELEASVFPDARLGKRFRSLVRRLWHGVGSPIPFACQDWSNTKAAYRFFSNPRVSEEAILSGHFPATASRFATTRGPILILHDTTEFSFKRENPEAVGVLGKNFTGTDWMGRAKMATLCGILMHSSLALTPEGLPLGLAAVKFWSRKQFKGCAALKRHINPTRVPIEEKESFCWLSNIEQSTALLQNPQRCVHIGDRDGDIYELFCTGCQANTHFLIRTCADRLAGKSRRTISKEMDAVQVKGRHRIEVRDSKGQMSDALLELKYSRLCIHPPIAKQRRYPDLDLTVIHAYEREAPPHRKPIDWKLITDLPVTSSRQAIEKLQWYAMRWKIEVFHKILKSGCRAEDARLRTAERLVNLLAVYCILAWRIFWMTMLQRSLPTAPPELALTKSEMNALDQVIADPYSSQYHPKDLAYYSLKIARLGGYLARSRDPPPGNMVMWRGLSRLTDIELGFVMGTKRCG